MAKEQEYTMSVELVRMFRQVVPELAGGMRSFTEVNELAIKRGYLVVPEACTGAVMDWLKDEKFDPNATFFKDWQYIQDNGNISLMFEQILHYITTYGTDFALGNGYVSNDGKDKPMMAYDRLKLVTAVSADELKARCVDMLKSGAALKESTCKALVDFVVATGGCPADEIPNKEAACLLHFHQGTHPSDPVEYVRYLVYLYTGSTLLIKSRRDVQAIRTSGRSAGYEAVSKMTDADIDLLAAVFFRFKPIFVAMKGSDSFASLPRKTFEKVAHVINRIRVRADKLKRPFAAGVLDTICVPGDDGKLKKIEEVLKGVTMFRKLRLYQCLIDREFTGTDENPMYTIRNGKMFIRKNYRPRNDREWIRQVARIVSGNIHDALRQKAKTHKVKLPANCVLTVPTSEKNFIGDYPMGTMIPLSEHNIVGVYWRNEWGTRDFDLSMVDSEGNGVSWHTGFKDGDYMHSGDMTNAEPEASECIYFRGKSGSGKVINLNQFNGSDPKSRYRLFIAKHDGRPKFNTGYMVDPKDIVLTVDGNIAAAQTALAVIDGQSIILLGTGSGSRIITFADGSTQSVIETVAKRYTHSIKLEGLLQLAGYEVVPADYEGEVDLDLTDMKRDTLIKFLADDKEENG